MAPLRELVAFTFLIFLGSTSSLAASGSFPTREQLHRMATATLRSNRLVELYTPSFGSPERIAIMDAIRLATGWDVKFKVDHLVAIRIGSKALAVAEVSDATNKTESSGIFELEGLSSQWRPLYSVGGGGGADDCKKEESILRGMVSKAQEYTDAKNIMPERFWQIVQENKSETKCWGTVSTDYSAPR